MPNMEFIHGLEKALEIINERKAGFEKNMKYYAEKYEDFSKNHEHDVFYAKLRQDYLEMYSDTKDSFEELDIISMAIGQEIDKELNVEVAV